MVLLWPWTRNDASPASFEKALSALATKIANTQAKLEQTRSSSRRVRVLCTLYLAFGYLVYTIVLALVVGRKKMGAWEWSGVAGGPVLIYTVRTVVAAYYNFRIDSLSSSLKDQQVERAKTIQRLKDATKYDSTLQLLEKYGGSQAPESDTQPGAGGRRTKGGRGRISAGPAASGPSTPNRTNMPPPPTANIAHSGGSHSAVQTPSSKHGTPRGGTSVLSVASSPLAAGGDVPDVTAEFAPNAFGPEADALAPEALPGVGSGAFPGGQYATGPGLGGESHWYDRILDLLMGDDETAARNRIVLICSACRLVNGQAPPGTHSLSGVGAWRCMGCGTLNGEAAEAEKLVSEVLGQQKKPKAAANPRAEAETESDAPDEEGDDSNDDGDDDDTKVESEIVVALDEAEEPVAASGKDVGERRSTRHRSKRAK